MHSFAAKVKAMKTIIEWFEIPVTDMARARAFYEEVFQTTLTPMDIGQGTKMCMFPRPDSDIGGALCENAEFYKPGREGPVLFLSTPDGITPTLDRARNLDATIQVPKRQVSPEHGYMAVFIDSEGNRIALYEH